MLHTIANLVATLAGFAPLVGTVFIVVALTAAACKLSPKVDATMDTVFNRLFGTDETYDERYAPEHTSTIDQYV